MKLSRFACRLIPAAATVFLFLLYSCGRTSHLQSQFSGSRSTITSSAARASSGNFSIPFATFFRKDPVSALVDDLPFTEGARESRLPLRERIPKVVHYIWCGAPRRHFEFKYYLSVMSSVKFLRPDVIYFHYDAYPDLDQFLYNTWLEELQHDMPFFLLEKVDFPMCDRKAMKDRVYRLPQWFYVSSILFRHGGVFVRENTIFSAPMSENLDNSSIIYAMSEDLTSGFFGTRQGLPETKSLEEFRKRHNKLISQISCVSIDEFKSDLVTKCVFVDDRAVYPADLWKTPATEFKRLASLLMYGTPEVPEASPSPEAVIPNNAHIVWLGGGRMSFIFYLCVLSLLHIVKADSVFIHGNELLTGPYWTKITNDPRVHFVHRTDTDRIYGRVVGSVHHRADVIRCDVMLKYGGLHLDPDVLFTKPIDPDLYKYDGVVSVDSYLFPMRPFPDVLSLGTVLSRAGARFWQLYQQSLKYYTDSDWTWNSGRIPYKIYERNPELLKLDPYLQVVCFKAKCYPTWMPTRQEAMVLANEPEKWAHKVTAWHLVDFVPAELQSEDSILKGIGVFAKIGKKILEAASTVDSR